MSTGTVMRPPPPAMESTNPAHSPVAKSKTACHHSIMGRREEFRDHPSWPAFATLRSVVFALPALRAKTGGAEGIRTPDPHNAIVVLYQLSYDPSQFRQFR